GAKHVVVNPSAYHSDGGRPLSGGGGIVPDVLLKPDTFTTAEQGFTRALDGQLAVFRDAVNATALDLKRRGAVRSEDFVVTDAMRADFRRRMEAGGVQLADSTFRGGEQIVDQQLGYELARYVFGPAAERRRRAQDDRQIGEAAALLRQAQTPSALLDLASAPAPAH